MENKEKTNKYPRSALVNALSVAVLALARAAFLWWGLTAKELTAAGIVTAGLSLAIFAIALVLMIPSAIRFFSGAAESAPHALGDRSLRREGRHPVLRLMLTLLLARLLVMLIAYVISNLVYGYTGSFFATVERIWLKLDTDAPHYFSIAENGYTTVEPQMYTIVFLPLFPMLIRVFNLVFGSSFASAMVINTLCTLGAGVFIYKLALLDMGRRSARIAVLFALSLPGAIFLIAPMSEALFLLLSTAALYYMRKCGFWLAAALCALAAFTRSVGIILIVPFFAEALNYTVRTAREKGRRGLWKLVLKMLACLAICCLGTFAYLLINKLVWGDWFKFVRFQREIWYQSIGPFFGSACTQMNCLIRSVSTELEDLFGLWLPNLLFTFGALFVFVFSARTLRTSYSLYFAVYFAIACGAAWLLSAPRYLSALTVLPIALALLCEGRDDGVALGRARAKTAIVSVLLMIGQLAYLVMYILGYSIY